MLHKHKHVPSDLGNYRIAILKMLAKIVHTTQCSYSIIIK